MVRVRKCSYCHLGGHNRRTCKTLAKDKELVKAATLKYRRIIANQMNKVGFVPGALVETSVGWRQEKKVCLVKRVQWSAVHPFQNGNFSAILLKSVNELLGRNIYSMGIGSLPASLVVPYRTFNPEERYDSAKSFQVESALCQLLAPGSKTNDAKEERYRPSSKNMKHIYSELNIDPYDYKADSKGRLDQKIDMLSKFIDDESYGGYI